MITASIVSHGHGAMIAPLLADLERCPEIGRIVLTLNIPEPPIPIPEGLRDKVTVLRNDAPLGFGANHNQAFRQGVSSVFCILNPDIRIHDNPFPALLELMSTGRHSLVAPAVVNPEGVAEDSVRPLPTPWGILLKAITGRRDRHSFRSDAPPFSPDWMAGMFLLARSDAYAALSGFDERYFLYYEDVDLCTRLALAGHTLAVCPAAQVVHAAQRASHRNFRFLRWHVSSMLRYFCSSGFWRYLVKQRRARTRQTSRGAG